MTMNGVMMPCVSAGSNQSGASDTCTPHAICPSGAAVAGVVTSAITASRARAATRNWRIVSLLIGTGLGMRTRARKVGSLSVMLRGCQPGRPVWTPRALSPAGASPAGGRILATMLQPDVEAITPEALARVQLDGMRRTLARVARNPAWARRLGDVQAGDVKRVDEWRQ